MSTDYMLRKPMSLHKIERLTGWVEWKSEDGHGLTDGDNFVHTDEDEKGRVVSYTRYGANDDSALDSLNVISENDLDDEDYERLFGEDWAA